MCAPLHVLQPTFDLVISQTSQLKSLQIKSEEQEKQRQMASDIYCTAGNFLRKKTFTNFMVLWLYAKVFSAKFLGRAIFAGCGFAGDSVEIVDVAVLQLISLYTW